MSAKWFTIYAHGHRIGRVHMTEREIKERFAAKGWRIVIEPGAIVRVIGKL